MSSPTFIITLKVLPLVKWGKSDGFQAPVPDLLAIVDQGFPNNFLSFRAMSPILVENNVIPLNLHRWENNSPKQRPDFMYLLEPSKGLSSKDTMFPMKRGWWNFWDDNLIGWCVTLTIESRRRQKFELMVTTGRSGFFVFVLFCSFASYELFGVFIINSVRFVRFVRGFFCG